jgi:hypothetical protein
MAEQLTAFEKMVEKVTKLRQLTDELHEVMAKFRME